jgi:hypothetical protein
MSHRNSGSANRPAVEHWLDVTTMNDHRQNQMTTRSGRGDSTNL